MESWKSKTVEKATLEHYPTAKFIDLIKKCQLHCKYPMRFYQYQSMIAVKINQDIYASRIYQNKFKILTFLKLSLDLEIQNVLFHFLWCSFFNVPIKVDNLCIITEL